LREVNADVVEGEKVLSARMAGLASLRWRALSTIGSALAVYLMLSHFLDVWLTMLHEPEIRAATLKVLEHQLTMAQFQALQHEHVLTAVRAQAGAMLVSLLTAFVVYRFGPEDASAISSHH
jgi:hypothetical protein